MRHILYLHGFNSAGNGNTTQLLRAALPDDAIHSPTYAGEQPLNTLAQLTQAVHAIQALGKPLIVVGTSLGAFWARVLSQQCGVAALLVNPAVRPSEQLRRHVGPNVNFATGISVDFTESALTEYAAVEALPVLHREAPRMTLIYQNDEVIDVPATCRHLIAEAEPVRLLPGGQHRIFADQIPDVVAALRALHD